MPGDCHPTRTVLGQGEGPGVSRALDSGGGGGGDLLAPSELWAPRGPKLRDACASPSVSGWVGLLPLCTCWPLLRLQAPRSDSPSGHGRANTGGRCRWTPGATCQPTSALLGQLALGSAPLMGGERANAVTHLSQGCWCGWGRGPLSTAPERVEKLGRRSSPRPSRAGP